MRHVGRTRPDLIETLGPVQPIDLHGVDARGAMGASRSTRQEHRLAASSTRGSQRNRHCGNRCCPPFDMLGMSKWRVLLRLGCERPQQARFSPVTPRPPGATAATGVRSGRPCPRAAGRCWRGCVWLPAVPAWPRRRPGQRAGVGRRGRVVQPGRRPGPGAGRRRGAVRRPGAHRLTGDWPMRWFWRWSALRHGRHRRPWRVPLLGLWSRGRSRVPAGPSTASRRRG